MFNILKSSAASVLALTVMAGAAAAVTQTVTFTDGTPGDNFFLPGFNSGLGTLISVAYTGMVSSVDYPTFGLVGITVANDGASDSAFGAAPGPIMAMVSNFYDNTDLASLAAFTDTPVFAAVSAPVDGTTTGSFSVTYTYDDGITPAPVPLPAGAPLLIAGIGGLAMLRKARKS